MSNAIEVDGLAELKRAIRGAKGKELRKEMGKANKAIGKRVIQRMRPLPKTVGAGRGSDVRPRARADGVVLATGGSHREHHFQQWGVRFVERDTKRPYILESALKQRRQIEEEYLEGLEQAMDGAFLVD